ncbi:hypothetical protein BBBOND_0200290 [Babesia bigemina]|uniref:Uncharacterized protein n=1 Tax=Babesia bigemina TaxID=5866 RepID=A0A061D4A0_BABBI|nr:hypothetical protein BBBOND_0200290 [Babesia bigemina]CDR94872.1 hypothetical protein BBBOND_0200290 [Babesia bigemina]|eukprot:XP_012767058.1 hypothetical protein BBBOND_0200290 [Babesia bigemina]
MNWDARVGAAVNWRLTSSLTQWVWKQHQPRSKTLYKQQIVNAVNKLASDFRCSDVPRVPILVSEQRSDDATGRMLKMLPQLNGAQILALSNVT